MSNTKMNIIASALAASLYSQLAFADEAQALTNTSEHSIENITTINATTPKDVIKFTRVEDENGVVFYNQYIANSELQAVKDIDVNRPAVKTYQFEHEDHIYTNKVLD